VDQLPVDVPEPTNATNKFPDAGGCPKVGATLLPEAAEKTTDPTLTSAGGPPDGSCTATFATPAMGLALGLGLKVAMTL
jgi:hypothetical protein